MSIERIDILMPTVTTTPNVTMLPIDVIRPNTLNPNQMSSDQVAALQREVERLGGLAKPIVVCAVDDGYEIIDGEHSWRAAREVGFEEVPCEIRDYVDDYELMRQCLVRNQHGEHNRVLEARVFELMQQERNLSSRGLSRELGMTEASIRNTLRYRPDLTFPALSRHLQSAKRVPRPLEKKAIGSFSARVSRSGNHGGGHLAPLFGCSGISRRVRQIDGRSRANTDHTSE